MLPDALFSSRHADAMALQRELGSCAGVQIPSYSGALHIRMHIHIQSMYMYTYVYIYRCMNVCVYIYRHIRVSLHVCMYIYTCISI